MSLDIIVVFFEKFYPNSQHVLFIPSKQYSFLIAVTAYHSLSKQQVMTM